MAGVKASGSVGYALQFYTVIIATNCEKTRHNVWVKWKRVLLVPVSPLKKRTAFVMTFRNSAAKASITGEQQVPKFLI